jgi:hypothetical protein
MPINPPRANESKVFNKKAKKSMNIKHHGGFKKLILSALR